MAHICRTSVQTKLTEQAYCSAAKHDYLLSATGGHSRATLTLPTPRLFTSHAEDVLPPRDSREDESQLFGGLSEKHLFSVSSLTIRRRNAQRGWGSGGIAFCWQCEPHLPASTCLFPWCSAVEGWKGFTGTLWQWVIINVTTWSTSVAIWQPVQEIDNGSKVGWVTERELVQFQSLDRRFHIIALIFYRKGLWHLKLNSYTLTVVQIIIILTKLHNSIHSANTYWPRQLDMGM